MPAKFVTRFTYDEVRVSFSECQVLAPCHQASTEGFANAKAARGRFDGEMRASGRSNGPALKPEPTHLNADAANQTPALIDRNQRRELCVCPGIVKERSAEELDDARLCDPNSRAQRKLIQRRHCRQIRALERPDLDTVLGPGRATVHH